MNKTKLMSSSKWKYFSEIKQFLSRSSLRCTTSVRIDDILLRVLKEYLEKELEKSRLWKCLAQSVMSPDTFQIASKHDE